MFGCLPYVWMPPYVWTPHICLDAPCMFGCPNMFGCSPLIFICWDLTVVTHIANFKISENRESLKWYIVEQSRNMTVIGLVSRGRVQSQDLSNYGTTQFPGHLLCRRSCRPCYKVQPVSNLMWGRFAKRPKIYGAVVQSKAKDMSVLFKIMRRGN